MEFIYFYKNINILKNIINHIIYISISLYNIASGHTKPKAPDPFRTPKLSGLRRG